MPEAPSSPSPALSEIAGLTSAEAAARLVRYGPNQLVRQQRARWLREVGGLLLDPMAIMLLAAAGLYGALGETRDAVIMLVALVPVLAVDVALEARSRAALARLAARIAPKARVLRDGREQEVPTGELVPGDVLVLREGDVLHADGVVRWAANLTIDESSLTGESEPLAKAPEPPADAAFWAGSLVVTGLGHGEVTATGPATRYAEIARLVSRTDVTPTPLQRRTGRLVRGLAIVALGVAAGVALLQLATGHRWAEAALAGISLAIAAVPEEFPLVFTLFLSLGAWRLGRRGVLVRRLASVETLGSTTVICTDKTGTLTRGEFTLDACVPLGRRGEAELLEAAVLACEAQAADPMERAIVDRALAAGITPQALAARWTLVRDHDFDPVGKHMSHVWQARETAGGAPFRVVAKGALEGVLQHCLPSPELRAAAEEALASLATTGMRVLAVAERVTAGPPGGSRDEDERELTPVGLLGFRDPLRPEVRQAVAECQRAGVRIKLVTGDHALTAHAIADQAGIAHEHAAGIVTGPELEALAPEARAERAAGASIFARISPAQKHALVEALCAAGEVVAMTGDGINDAPALRRADIGVSMGHRATEVARASADMVLVEDDFTAIVAAVREGRRIYRDLQRAFLYLVGFHIPIVALALVVPLWGVPLLLLPVHLVWLELIVHPVSAFLFWEPQDEAGLMAAPPRPPSAPLLPRRALVRSIATGALLTVATFGTYLGTLHEGELAARGAALVALIFGYQLLVFAERGRGRLPGWRFWVVWGLTAASLPLALTVRPLAEVLRLSAPPPSGWAVALVAGAVAVGWRFMRG